jgi:hypothetical protein
VYVIGHQAIRVDLAAGFRRGLPEQPEIRKPIRIREETGVSIITALHDMQRYAWKNRPDQSGHRPENARHPPAVDAKARK